MEFIDNSDEDSRCKWETESFGALTIKAFAPTDNEFDAGVVEDRGGDPRLEMVGAEGIEITFGSCRFGGVHDGTKPMGDAFDGSGE